MSSTWQQFVGQGFAAPVFAFAGTVGGEHVGRLDLYDDIRGGVSDNARDDDYKYMASAEIAVRDFDKIGAPLAATKMVRRLIPQIDMPKASKLKQLHRQAAASGDIDDVADAFMAAMQER